MKEGIIINIMDYNKYYGLHCNKLNNLHEVDKFLEIYKLLKLTNEAIENPNKPITEKEIELIIIKNTYPRWKAQA